MHRAHRVFGALLTLSLVLGCASAPPVRLRRIVLYQSGIGYFERSGNVQQGEVHLRLAPHEVDDVLTTLTVIDPDHPASTVSPSVVLPSERSETESTDLALRLGARDRPLTITYAAPTSAWRASYRIVLPDGRGDDDAWFQAWAVVDNSSREDWDDVDLTLATDAPLSFAVDLRTPRRVERPTVDGYHAPPIAFGVVMSEHSTRGDRDGDSILDAYDACPEDPEDRDTFEDADGCPDPDSDHDGILDVDDRCPSDAEAFNGLSDDDGCPDRGHVVVESTSIRLLEAIYFEAGESALSASSGAILDAIASALRGNPEIARVEVRGHADRGEEHPYALSAERAVAVQRALETRGIAAARMIAIPLGDSEPISGDAERNRRTDFEIREDEAPPPPRGAVQRAAIEASRTVRARPEVSGTGTRFPVARGVRIPAGQSAMVAILEQAMPAQEVLLYRIDPAVPTSQSHPFRAARFVNVSGVDLVTGPVSLFQSGELVGEGMLDALAVGQNAFIPYAIDVGTHIALRAESEVRPSRVLSIERGVVRLERTEIARSHYDLELGARAPARIYVRHPRTAGFEPHDLPPGSETNPNALLVALPIEANTQRTLTVDERRLVDGTIDLSDPRSGDLRPFLEGSALSPADEARLITVLDDRDALIRIDEEMQGLRHELADAASRSAELRQSLIALDERAGRVVSAARRSVASQLEEAVAVSERISARLATRGAELIEARLRLRTAAEAIMYVPTPR